MALRQVDCCGAGRDLRAAARKRRAVRTQPLRAPGAAGRRRSPERAGGGGRRRRCRLRRRSRARFYEDSVERVLQLPGVESASVSMYPPLSGGDGAWTDNVGMDGTPPGAGSTVYFNTVSRGYFSTTGMTLVRGRDIDDADVPTSLPVAVINETLARRFFPGQDPIGRHLTTGRAASRRDLLDSRACLRHEISAPSGGAAPDCVPALASTAWRQHVHRGARRVRCIGGGGGQARRCGRSTPSFQ